MNTHYGPSGDYDDNATYSLIMTAYLSRLKVRVNLNEAPKTACGITASTGFWQRSTDYVELVEYDE